MKGTVKRIKGIEGYGFIKGEDGRQYFFHRSALANGELEALEEGTEVTFKETETSRGPRAEGVFV